MITVTFANCPSSLHEVGDELMLVQFTFAYIGTYTVVNLYENHKSLVMLEISSEDKTSVREKSTFLALLLLL